MLVGISLLKRSTIKVDESDVKSQEDLRKESFPPTLHPPKAKILVVLVLLLRLVKHTEPYLTG